MAPVAIAWKILLRECSVGYSNRMKGTMSLESDQPSRTTGSLTPRPAAGVRRRRALILDSGLGGLSVLSEIAEARPDIDAIYIADDAAFPYGDLGEAALVARIVELIGRGVAEFSPDIVVIACNTASTLVLAPLRAAHRGLPFVGTVPAVKPAAQSSRSGLISVLATPGTVARDYTHALVRDYAAACEVTLVGSARLAAFAEAHMRGRRLDEGEVAREIAPCFIEREGRRTDHVVLACTHFPLLRESLLRLAPWPVEFVDPAPAIARRVDTLLGPSERIVGATTGGVAIFTSGRTPPPTLQKALRRHALNATPSAALSRARR
jgi:glutamate racemase